MYKSEWEKLCRQEPCRPLPELTERHLVEPWFATIRIASDACLWTPRQRYADLDVAYHFHQIHERAYEELRVSSDTHVLDPILDIIIVNGFGGGDGTAKVVGSQESENLGWDVSSGGDNLQNGEPDVPVGAPGYDSENGDDSGRVVQTSSTIPSDTHEADSMQQRPVASSRLSTHPLPLPQRSD